MTEVRSERTLLDEIYKFSPSEIICNEAFYMSGIDLEELKNRLHAVVTALENRFFSDDSCRKLLREHFHVNHLDGLGISQYEAGTIAAGAVLQYLCETQKSTLEHLTGITPYTTGQYMMLDTSTRRNLELTETLREKQKRGTLLWVLDKTKTAMGARMLRSFVEQPLISRERILDRQNAVEELNMNYISREEMAEYLNAVYDLERLIGRISYKTANPRDLIAFKSSLAMLPHIKQLLGEFQSPLLRQVDEEMDTLADLTDLIERAIVEEPPISVREGGMIKDGYSEEADRLRHENQRKVAGGSEQGEGKDWNQVLKVKFNKVFGYYFQVTNSQGSGSDYFIRQTLTNANVSLQSVKAGRFDSGAEDKLLPEYDLFCRVRDAGGESGNHPEDGQGHRPVRRAGVSVGGGDAPELRKAENQREGCHPH
ncbi:MAG: hypothetical protein ACLVFV_00990 [Clostridium sp.]